MARGLQVFTLLCRLYAPTTSSLVSWRFGSSKAWSDDVHGNRRSFRYSDEMSDGEQELEDVEDKLQALIDEERKRQRTVKYHILKRQMTPSGAPQRKLTWDAIEQIRYLKREQPEEWTTERLAEGFSVTPDMILRVLRSKFTPSLDRKIKQDAKVMARVGQQMLPSGAGTQQDKLKLPVIRTPAILPPGKEKRVSISVSDQTQMIQIQSTGIPVAVTALTKQLTDLKDAALTSSATNERVSVSQPTEEDEEREDNWDGQVLTEEDLEKFLEMDKPAVVQVGKDFFDEEGNFLYRI